MLGMKIKDEFILNTLFPNDLMSDIVDVKTQEEMEAIEQQEEEESQQATAETSEEDIMSLFESGSKLLKQKTTRNHIKLFTVKSFGLFDVVNYKLKLNID